MSLQHQLTVDRHHCSLITCINVHPAFRPSINNSWYDSLEGCLWLAAHPHHTFSIIMPKMLFLVLSFGPSQVPLQQLIPLRDHGSLERGIWNELRRGDKVGGTQKVSLQSVCHDSALSCCIARLHGFYKGFGLCRNCRICHWALRSGTLHN